MARPQKKVTLVWLKVNWRQEKPKPSVPFVRALAIANGVSVGIARLCMPTETESICCQEMDVLGDRLDLEGKKSTILNIYI